MRKLIYDMIVSLDGFIEGPNHNIDWGIIDEELHQFFNDQQAEVDTFLYGRRMYETMSAYWPTAEEDPSNPGYILEWARIWMKMPKIVFSKTLEKVEWNSRLVRENIIEEVLRLKAQPGKSLSVGGANIAATFIKHNLIDEYQLFIQPIILGSGTPYFPALSDNKQLMLVENRRFGCGVVLLRYQKQDIL
jgi:dihydrofolate reductase